MRAQAWVPGLAGGGRGRRTPRWVGPGARVLCPPLFHRCCTPTHTHAPACAAELGARELLARGREEELREQEGEVRLGAALCGLSVLRQLTDHAPGL